MSNSLKPSDWTDAALLGVTQLVAFGTSLYLLGVFIVPIHLDTGWPLPLIAAGLSAGIVVNGLMSPHVGKAVRAGRGGAILGLSSLLFAAGLMLIGAAHNVYVYFAGWAVLGAGMASGLYDTVFGALGTRHDRAARPMISLVALVGGFASTVGWTVSGSLLRGVDWRICLDLFAAAHLVINLPIFAWVFRHKAQATGVEAASASAAPVDRRVLLLVAGIFMVEAFVTTGIGVHLITLFREMGRDLGFAVAFGAIVGPCQVAGRLLEMTLGRRLHPLITVIIAACTVTASLILLAVAPMAAALALALYGAAIGVLSIARGLLPLELFGREHYAVVMGRLGRPIAFAQALAPALAAGLVDSLPAAWVFAAIASASALALVAALALRAIVRPV